MNEQIINWLADFQVDQLGPGAGWAVFPQGQRVLSRTTDILGNRRVRKRLSFRICRNSPAPAGQELEQFSLWAEQSAPKLGKDQTVTLEDARLVARTKEGMGRWEAKLILEFTV